MIDCVRGLGNPIKLGRTDSFATLLLLQHDMILQSIRRYLAYPLSYRDIEELMAERVFSVDHNTINR